jgi:hypothetical protein
MPTATLNGLISAVAARMGNYLSGTTTTGSTVSRINDTSSLIQPNKFWINFYLRLMGTNENTTFERVINDSAQGYVDVSPALPNGTTISAGTKYEIKQMQTSDYVQAIHSAIYAAGDRFMKMVDDTTSIRINTRQEYDLPVDLVLLHAAYTGWNNHWVPLTNYEILGVPGSYKILIGSVPEWPYTSVTIPKGMEWQFRMEYTSMQPDLLNGDSALSIQGTNLNTAFAYIQEYALHVLNLMAVSRNATGEKARAHLTLSDNHRAEAERIKNYFNKKPVFRNVQTRKFSQTIY